MNKIKTAQITTGIGGEYQSSIHIHNYLVSKGIRDSVIKANPDKMFSFKFFDEGLLSKRFLTRIKIESDNIEMLEWLWKHNFPRDEFTFAFAIDHGSIDILQWLYAHNFPYSKYAKDKLIELQIIKNEN